MSGPNNSARPPLSGAGAALYAGLCVVAGLWLWRYQAAHPGFAVGALLCGLIAVMQGLRALGRLGAHLADLWRFWRALRVDSSRGSAGWLTEKEAWAAGLHRRGKGKRFIGVLGRTALFMGVETHQLLLGPSGTAKTSAAILPFLANCPDSALINDTKGELYAMTRRLRRRRFGHRIVKLDPKDPQNSARINALDVIHGFYVKDSPECLSLVRGMARQLHPDPQGGKNDNAFFYDGARMLISTTALVVVAIAPPQTRNLAHVYRLLSDMEALHEALLEASQSKALGGELSQMAESLHRMAFGDDGAAKTFEQFRMGAMQAMEAFGPGNYLAAITSETTFSFTDLKTQKVSCYLSIDYANREVLGKFSGLMQWLAVYQLVGVGNNKPVYLVLDECCNAPLQGLPTVLTLLRSAGVRCLMATQDLDDFTRVYGKNARESVLSETPIKQILGGVRSQATLEYISKLLGEYSAPSYSYNLSTSGPGGAGDSTVQPSLSRSGRKLQTEDEIRRLPEHAQIVIYKSLRPALCRKVQIFAIAPWRSWLGINRAYGKRRKIMRTMVKIGWLGVRVTRRGRFAVPKEAKPSFFWPLLGRAMGRFTPPVGPLLAAVLLGTLWIEGLPYVRVSQHGQSFYDTAGIQRGLYQCRYRGLTPLSLRQDPPCPVIVFRKHW